MEWFRFDCNTTHGKIAQRLRKKFKSAGFDFYLMIWDDAHRTDDYYLPWDDDDIDLYCDELQIDEETGRAIFDYLIEKRIFYRIDHPRFGTVLTNETIQRGFIPTANERARKRAKTGDGTYPVDNLIWILPEKETGEYIIPTDYGYTPRNLPGSSTEYNNQFPGSSPEALGNIPGSSDAFHVQTESKSTYTTDTTNSTETDISEREDRKGESEGETRITTDGMDDMDEHQIFSVVHMYNEYCCPPLRRLNEKHVSQANRNVIVPIIEEYTLDDIENILVTIGGLLKEGEKQGKDSSKFSFSKIMQPDCFQKIIEIIEKRKEGDSD